MNRHKHADKIIAKAENMDLVIITKGSGSEWYALDAAGFIPAWFEAWDYFLCLEEHTEACLHWLNGGDIEHDDCDQGWVTMENINYPMDPCEPLWSPSIRLMTKDQNFRVKPKKEKRVIGVNVKTGQTTSMYTLDEEGNYAEDEVRLTKGGLSTDWQIIEIEVEVNRE